MLINLPENRWIKSSTQLLVKIIRKIGLFSVVTDMYEVTRQAIYVQRKGEARSRITLQLKNNKYYMFVRMRA
jgi:hypothetical protein